MDTLKVTLLDGFEVRVGPNAVTINGARPRQVLAYLALHQGTTVSAVRLCEAIWGEAQPVSARNSIQRFVSDARRDLGTARTRLESVGNGYRLVLDERDWCDAVALEQTLPRARDALADGRPGDALELVTENAKLHSEPLASIEGAVFVSSERERLSEILADCGEVTIEARLAQGDSSGAITSAGRLITQHPYRERVCIALATGLTRVGRANDALAALATFRSRLAEDLGLNPSPAVERTEQDILLHRNAGRLSSPRPHASRLTKSLDFGLFGRAVQIAHAVELLETKRYVTLTGPGGMGKPRPHWPSSHRGNKRTVVKSGWCHSKMSKRKASQRWSARSSAPQRRPKSIRSARSSTAYVLTSICWCSTTANTSSKP